ncbi:hypothetical protein [Sphingomonas sp.]|uniref:hypothetical protein n=1 Tax=Sphingomonas sp. TaxID=28214 RepID=UPI001B24A7F0|nr:hypothetical protein [Sphingomonas sp.]MBO9713664.1 hypothetical protein [Sphingomonas sp.]
MRSSLFLAAAVLIAAPAFAQTAPTPAPTPAEASGQDGEGPAIVVTGQSLADTARVLNACVERSCPTDEDIAAAVSHAENQFVAGDYKGARGTLAATMKRNQRYAKQYPIPFSDLLRADARIAVHLGDGAAYRKGMVKALTALESGVSGEDPRVLIARIEVGDALVSTGRYAEAQQRYEQVIGDARRIGQPTVQGFAMLRLASMRAQLAATDPAWRKSAGEALDQLIASTDPKQAAYASAARAMKARLEARLGDSKAADALIAELRRTPTEKPVLVVAPPVDLAGARRTKGEPEDPRWVDVTYWIAPDGSTTDADVLRQGGPVEPAWSNAVLASIRTRRYAPLKRDPSDPGVLRVERYSFTFRKAAAPMGWLGMHESQVRLEMLDLSSDDAEPAEIQIRQRRS